MQKRETFLIKHKFNNHPNCKLTMNSKRGQEPRKRKATKNPVLPEEEAEVDSILKERARRGKKQFLCSWMDGAEPQWVDGDQLENTPVLREWEYSADDDKEIRDSPKEIERKCQQLKEWIGDAKRVCWLLGAGISAPVLPTFRGKGGLWTRNPTENTASFTDAEPTVAHKALLELEKAGKVYLCATQNYDGLSLKSGFPAEKLSELHGNIFVEKCEKCATRYVREYEVVKDDAEDHETGRTCDRKDCKGMLKDNIVHFDESLPWKELSLANAKFVAADLTVVLGSSLRVHPAAGLPFKSKRRRRLPPKPKAVIVNLQETPMDDEADLLIHATCDEVLQFLTKKTG